MATCVSSKSPTDSRAAAAVIALAAGSLCVAGRFYEAQVKDAFGDCGGFIIMLAGWAAAFAIGKMTTATVDSLTTSGAAHAVDPMGDKTRDLRTYANMSVSSDDLCDDHVPGQIVTMSMGSENDMDESIHDLVKLSNEPIVHPSNANNSKAVDFFHNNTDNVPHVERPFNGSVDIKGAYFKCDTDPVDERDVKTPDSWVRRNPDLIRLTGRHPFNCEPPLPQLMQAGFITPPALHYVRNHGAVPIKTAVPADRQRVWDEWTITVDGLVDKPLTLTMNDLMRLPQRELPVLLVCAGNRRKEQNQVHQTVGFGWGAAGLGCR